MASLESLEVNHGVSVSQGACRVFSMRIVCLDYYMARPLPNVDHCYSQFQGQSVLEVPIIRVYGSTLAGQKACMHIHKVLPYFYVPYDDDLPQEFDDALTFVRHLALAIEKAMKLATHMGFRRQHVHSCCLVRGRRFYGFHCAEQLFIKVTLYHPQEILRVSALLWGGGILGRKFQPYESHIPYLLQFMVNYNLNGMSHLHLSKLVFRQPLPEKPRDTSNLLHSVVNWAEAIIRQQGLASDGVSKTSHSVLEATNVLEDGDAFHLHGMNKEEIGNDLDKTQDVTQDVWLKSNIPSDWVWPWIPPDGCQDFGRERYIPSRLSKSELEADASAEDIINKKEVQYIPLSQADPNVKMVQSLVPIWEEESLRSGNYGPAASGANQPPVKRAHHLPVSPPDHLKEFLLEVIAQETMHAVPVEGSVIQERPYGLDSLGYCPHDAFQNFPEVAPAERGGSSRTSVDKTPPGSPKTPALYQVTQVAYGKDLVAQMPIQEGGTSVKKGTFHICSETGEFLGVRGSPFPLNEELIKRQLRERQLKEEEKEALDLLQWMIDDVDEGANEVENREDEANLSQIMKTEGVEAILKRSLCNYEVSSQQECESILECSEDFLLAACDSDSPTGHIKTLNKSEDDEKEKLSSVPEATCIYPGNAVCDSGTRRAEYVSAKVRQSDAASDEEFVEPFIDHVESPIDEKKLLLNLTTSQVYAHLAKGKTKVEMHMKVANSLPVAESSNKWGSLPVVTRGSQPSRSDIIGMSEEHEGLDRAFTKGFHANFDKRLNVTKNHKKGCAYLPKTIDMVEGKWSAQNSPDSGGLDKLSVRDLMRYKRVKKPCRRIMDTLDEKHISIDAEKETNMQVSGDSEALHEDTSPTTEKGTVCTSLNMFKGEASDNFPDTNLSSSRLLDCPDDSHILTFHKQPPSKLQLLETFKDYSIRPVVYDSAFYGDARDIPAQPSVMAGLLFDVRSRSSNYLRDFEIDGKSCASGGKRPYIQEENWGPPEGSESLTGGYSYYENDGTLLFMLTPVQPPPLFSSLPSADKSVQDVAAKQLNMSQKLQDSSEELFEYFKPASPKYDEKHVLNLETPFLTQGAQSSGIHPPQLQETRNKDNSTLRFALPHNVCDTTNIPTERFSRNFSQVTAPSITLSETTPLSQVGFRDPATLGGGQQVTLMSIEMHAQTRGDLRPDPRYDSICCISIVIKSDSPSNQTRIESLVLLCDNIILLKRDLNGLIGCKVITLPDEISLLQCFVKIVCVYDPDMVVGWEVQGFSLGFLAERAANLGIGILKQLSRSVDTSHKHESETALMDPNEPSIVEDEWGRTHGSGIHINGRIILNLWRIIRGELKLNIYTLEAVAEAVLRRRVPRIPWHILTQWFLSGSGRDRFRCLEYVVNRTKLNLEIMDQLDLVNRTAELARVFGIDFFSVLSRGSQYRVESMMLRLAHTQNFLMISPTREQVFAQPAMECLPLVMEPESRFYTSPVVVLDFQSLYPSIIIAYNLCYSTCLGKIGLNNPKILGVTSLTIENGLLSKLKDDLTIAPNGVLYVPPEVNPGVLPRLLQEILSTRILVKQAMKNLSSSQKVMQRVLNARQAALKLIANVTYGYTAAGFSGRMPCAELADSIVQFGRHTLEQAIQLVNKNPRWDAHVVYGDTDSMFVLLEGRSRDEAFKIGQEIATAVTELNPHPVTLKMEKVYHPCVLLTKKRYAGYSFESPSQTKPKFDAKGIETVRRDSCNVVAKCMERSLRILFETNDLSQVKQYLERQLQKILQGRVSIRDFIFAKEVRLGTYSAKLSVLPPAAIVASKAMVVDPRAEPRYGERVQYVVVHGEPGARLVDMVVDPYVLLDNPGKLRLHDTYYINKQILPALQRIFGLLGVDLRVWYSEMSRVYRPSALKRLLLGASFLNANSHKGDLASKKADDRFHARGTIDQYYLSQHCTVCGELTTASQLVCSTCSENEVAVATILTKRCSQMEKEFNHLQAICWHCGGRCERYQPTIACISLECPVFYERRKVEALFRSASYLAEECGFLPTKPSETFKSIADSLCKW